MKTVKHLVITIILLTGIVSQGQVAVNVNVGPPVWGPPVTVEKYYYLPDVESYYDIRTSQFIYARNGNWIRAKSLPTRYRNYNLNSGNVIVLNDYQGRNPYIHYKTHKVKYVKKWNNGNKNGHSSKSKRNKKHKD